MPFDYTTSANVFAYGNSAGTATDPVNEGTVMGDLVTAMSRAIDVYCSQAFSLATYTAQIERALIDADGVLTCWPAVPTLATPTAAAWRQAKAASWATLDPSLLDVETNTFGSVVRVLNSNLLSYRGVGRVQMRLTFTGGWANLAAVPQDFEWAMRALCWWAYQKRSAPDNKTAVPELGVLIIPSNWPGHIKQMFKQYVKQVPM